ncbi:mannan endo-1,4-beta-mannosidase [Procambarus clarkii]|uniref:mannan endo-1,4-beta-mannosidase n=1 Tax=Procambarus clarkii TaxID=6728 RepID=UPI001E672BD2|nr:mannan endo-1,4-beta-mannosidase-like [Procambarus clarkii]
MAAVLFLTLLALLGPAAAKRLAASGAFLTYGGQKTFLNGANIPWNNIGDDFGNGAYDGTLETWVKNISSAGGNSIRVFVHSEGFFSPLFADGYVVACDLTGQLENDVLQLLNVSAQHNVLVNLVLWNGASSVNKKDLIDLINDDMKLDFYIDLCLKSLVNTTKGHPALASYEVMNEPEGFVKVASSSNPCYDTTVIGEAGAGWTGEDIPMEKLLRFIGRQNQAIRSIDSETLITIGSFGQFAQNDVYLNSHNHYTDECLNGAAGGTNAHLDFYQMHAFDWLGSWSPHAPFNVSATDYNLHKPIVIGAFSGTCGAGSLLRDLYEYAYIEDYSGGFSWHYKSGTGECVDSREVVTVSLGHLATRIDHGIVAITVE